MEIWLVLDNDEQGCIEAKAYIKKESAIKYAKNILEEKNTGKEDIEDNPTSEEVPYNMIYSCNGDHVRVELVEVLED